MGINIGLKPIPNMALEILYYMKAMDTIGLILNVGITVLIRYFVNQIFPLQMKMTSFIMSRHL